MILPIRTTSTTNPGSDAIISPLAGQAVAQTEIADSPEICGPSSTIARKAAMTAIAAGDEEYALGRDLRSGRSGIRG